MFGRKSNKKNTFFMLKIFTLVCFRFRAPDNDTYEVNCLFFFNSFQESGKMFSDTYSLENKLYQPKKIVTGIWHDNIIKAVTNVSI